MSAPPIFPTLNLGFSFVRRPQVKTLVATAGSGRQVRTRLWAYPLWEWDLVWEYLPDDAASGAVTAGDLQTLLGTFLDEAGAYGSFLFFDPNENRVTAQPLGTGDGSTTVFTLMKSFGLGGFVGTEPIGYIAVNGSMPLNVYLNGVLQSYPAAYSYNPATPCAQTITFATAPANGVAITADVSFFYYAHFKDDKYDFENFMQGLWAQRKITIASLKD